MTVDELINELQMLSDNDRRLTIMNCNGITICQTHNVTSTANMDDEYRLNRWIELK